MDGSSIGGLIAHFGPVILSVLLVEMLFRNIRNDIADFIVSVSEHIKTKHALPSDRCLILKSELLLW